MDPDARFASIEALIDHVTRAIAPPAPPAPRSRRGPILAGALGLAAIGGSIVWVAIPDAAETCEAPTVPADLWAPSRRPAFVAAQVPDVAPRIDRWFATWSAAAA